MVNIPSPLANAKEGRSAVLQATYWLVVRAMRRVLRQIRAPLLQVERKVGGFAQRQFEGARFQEKLLSSS